MRIGISFPQTEIGKNRRTIRDFALAAEELGFDHISVLDHVVQSGSPDGPEFSKNYTRQFMFHEPFQILSYFSAITEQIGLATAVLILPQRQTALVAKQASAIDVLSGGRLRLGVGLGWNKVEFESLKEDFHNRGRRSEEQIEVLRALWTQDIVDFNGQFHRLPAVGINPEPVQRPIPVWIGAMSAPALKRAARIGDGWFVYPRLTPGDDAKRQFDIVQTALAEAGRDAGTFGINATVYADNGGPEEWWRLVEEWQALGANLVTFRTMECGREYPEGHLTAMRQLMESAEADNIR